jgi:cell filamentation protein
MALQAGFRRPTFEPLLNQHRDKYFAAVRAGLDRNYEPMRLLFESIAKDRGF